MKLFIRDSRREEGYYGFVFKRQLEAKRLLGIFIFDEHQLPRQYRHAIL